MFRQARQNRVFQDVVDQIQEAIVDGRIRPGQQLPAERELKDQFGISRGTLREALRVLEQKGLIHIKTGVAGGAIVKGVTTEQISENLGLLIRYRKVSLQNLAEFREALEGLVAGLAAERATGKDIKRLQELLDEARRNMELGPEHWDDFIRVDEQIHMELSVVTDNILYITVLQTVYHNIHTYYESYLPLDEKIVRENYDDLVNIVDAVDRRDPQRAREMAQDHVRRFNTYMERREKK
jgi:GntR family transcriptional regulator, transcriptional repressor for pyruvate dehydrogenase complex